MIQVMDEKSTPSTVRWSTAEFIRQASQYKSVLDVGCGRGRVLIQVKANMRIGIDVCEKAIRVARKQAGPLFICEDLRTYLWSSKLLPRVECVIGMDIIEHFEKKDAWELLQVCERAASKCLLWFIPVGYHPQIKDDRGFGNDYFQTHRSQWQPKEMDALGYDVWFYPNWHKTHEPPREKGAMWCRKLLA